MFKSFEADNHYSLQEDLNEFEKGHTIISVSFAHAIAFRSQYSTMTEAYSAMVQYETKRESAIKVKPTPRLSRGSFG